MHFSEQTLLFVPEGKAEAAKSINFIIYKSTFPAVTCHNVFCQSGPLFN